ncbi:hypothetical protein [Micromonospora sp. WMMD1082]|uniref:hypothetical protein n=1 Tax=Micromonospora sp. WMMD1082 TaxID=3016104 RepID=UPI002416EE38|nr:hypothetical protein [Micromonospora sp. WMMD1082]MDG4795028.1 hypothetical protein [Micromonospora sp. WMMD1082]
MATDRLSRRASTSRFEVHNVGNTMLTVGPRHHPPLSDDLVLAVGHRSYFQSSSRSVLLTRAQVRELLDWLNAWYEHGWDGVPREEGPTTADVVEHYHDIAIRERIRADHERIDAHRLLHAAIALIPAGYRSQDLDEVALAEGRAWMRLQKENDHLEGIRRALVQGLWEIEQSTTPSADALRNAATRLLKANKPFSGEVSDAEAADTPLHRHPRLVTAADLLPPRC